MPVRVMLRSMTYRELLKWGIYYNSNPFVDWREDYRIAQLCALQANMNRDPKKRSQPWTPEHFMPFHAAEKKRRRAEEGNVLDPELEAALMKVAGPTLLREKLKIAAPHLPNDVVEKIAKGKRG